MTTAQIIELDGTQAVRLPGEFRFASATVSIRKDGQAVVLEPLKAMTWPPTTSHLPPAASEQSAPANDASPVLSDVVPC